MARTAGSTAEETRQRILDTAATLFAERGFAGTSIRDIAEHIGTTKAALYYHFRSKEDLLQALVAPFLAEVDALMAATDAGEWTKGELVSRLIDLLEVHGTYLHSAFADPSVKHLLFFRVGMPARIRTMERVLGGSDDPMSLLRGRCALGALQAGLLGGMPDLPPDFDPEQASLPAMARRLHTKADLTDAERRRIACSVLAVLRAD